jgi:hypothetical protein
MPNAPLGLLSADRYFEAARFPWIIGELSIQSSVRHHEPNPSAVARHLTSILMSLLMKPTARAYRELLRQQDGLTATLNCKYSTTRPSPNYLMGGYQAEFLRVVVQ